MNKIKYITLLSLLFFFSSCQPQENSNKSNLKSTKLSVDSSAILNEKINTCDDRKNQNPLIDGIINNKEWSKSNKHKLYGGDSIFFLKSDDTLFIAVRGNSGGFTSMGFSNGNQLKIIHASTGLITAEYEKINNDWLLVYGFKDPRKKTGAKYPRNNERLGNEYKKSQVEQFGWYANLIEMGKHSETEFMIPISSLPKGDLYFSVVFYQIKSGIKKAKFPKSLSDAMLNQELISGSSRNKLDFKVETWVRLSEIY